MLRVHFLNVGHGDCTIVKHPSGRLTMIDINNSQEYDRDSFGALWEETAKAVKNPLIGTAGVSGILPMNPMLRAAPGPSPLAAYFEATSKAQQELTDPIDFLQKHYPGETLWRLVLTHPDLDHMRGLQRLYETVGFDNLWDTNHTKTRPSFRSDSDRDDWALSTPPLGQRRPKSQSLSTR